MTHDLKKTGMTMAEKAADAASAVAMAAIKEWWERHIPAATAGKAKRKLKKPYNTSRHQDREFYKDAKKRRKVSSSGKRKRRYPPHQRKALRTK